MVVVGALAAACSHSSSGDDGRSLDAAINRVESERKLVVEHVATVLRAASRLDAGDALGLAGESAKLTKLRPDIVANVAKASPIVPTLASTFGYDDALRALSTVAAADHTLTTAQRDAIAEVVSSGTSEADAAFTLVKELTADWPRFLRVDEVQDVWLKRVYSPKGNWYRTQKESADGYQVLMSATERSALDAARDQLASLDAARTRAGRNYGVAIQAADLALAG